MRAGANIATGGPAREGRPPRSGSIPGAMVSLHARAGLVGLCVLLGCGRSAYDGMTAEADHDAGAVDGGLGRTGDPLCVEPGQGLVAFYPIDGDVPRMRVRDHSGTGADALCDSDDTCPSVGAGRIGDGLVFSPGVAVQRLRVTPTMAQRDGFDGSPGVTVAAFVRLDQLPLDDGVIASKRVSEGDHDSWTLEVRDGGELLVDVDLEDVDGSPQVIGSTLTLGETVHVALTVDSLGDLSLYRDGEIDANQSDATMVVDDDEPVIIGADQDADDVNDAWYGMIDELRIYDRALSADEIAIIASCD